MFAIYEKNQFNSHSRERLQVKLTAQKGRASLSLSKSTKARSPGGGGAKKPLAAMDFGGGWELR
jgi:hypothetical protein